MNAQPRATSRRKRGEKEGKDTTTTSWPPCTTLVAFDFTATVPWVQSEEGQNERREE